METALQRDWAIWLRRQRRIVVDILLGVTVALGTVGLIASIVRAVNERNLTFNLYYYTAAYIVILVLFAFRRIPDAWRALGFIGVVYLFAALSLYTGWLAGSGRAFLLTLIVAAAVLVSPRAGFAAAVVSALTFGAFGLAFNQSWLRLQQLPDPTSTPPVIVEGVAFVLALSLIAVSLWLFGQALMAASRANQDAQERRASFHSIVECSSDGVVVVDQAGAICFANAAALILLDGSWNEMVGQPAPFPLELDVPHELTPGAPDRLAPRRVLELRVVETEWQGRAARLALLRDITLRKQAEEARAQSEAMLHTLLETLPQNVYSKDVAGRFTYANQHYCATEGRALGEILGKTDSDLHPLPLAQKYLADDRRVLESGQTFETVEEHQLPGGQLAYVQVVKTPLRSGDGRIIGTLGIFWDVTERRRAEREREILQQLALALTAPLTLKELVKLLAVHCRQLLLYDSFRFDLYDEQAQLRTPVYAEDTPADGPAPVDVETDGEAQQPAIIRAVFDGRPVLVNRKPGMVSDGLTPWGFPRRSQSMLFVPVRWQGRCGGVVYVQSYTPERYSDRDLMLLQMVADQCGAALARVQADEALRMNELRYRALFERTNDAVLLLSLDGVHLAANRRAVQLLGYSEDELVGMSSRQVIAPEEYAQGLDRLQALRTGEALPIYECTFVRKDGLRVAVEINAAVVYNQNGEPLHIQSIVRDITERKQTEEALRESEQRYRTLVESFPDIVMITDLAGRVLYANAALEKQTGLTLEDLQLPRSRIFIHPDDLGIVRDATRDLLTSDKRHTDIIENRFIDKYDRVRWYSGIIAKTSYEGKLALQTVTRDITARKQIETEREKLIAELEAKNAELERFTYTVSHDLKSPLVTIRGFLGFVEKDALAGNVERARADIARITSAADKMQRLLNELLELSRIGRMMNPPQAVPFEAIVREALDLVRGQIDARGVQVDIAPDLPTVQGDRARLVEVVQNLVDNACKFMGDQPAPRIEIGQRGTDADGKPIFFVRDNGIGIEPQYHGRVFGLFDKLDAQSDGTGVGLALVKRIVEFHGGRIWVESEGFSTGTTFYFTLPQHESAGTGVRTVAGGT